MTDLRPPAIDASLSGYLNEDNQFTRLPGKKQKRKLDLMIAFLASQFTEGEIYTEQQVNELLNKHHSFKDPATLRRLLIGTGQMDRSKDGLQYWLIG